MTSSTPTPSISPTTLRGEKRKCGLSSMYFSVGIVREFLNSEFFFCSVLGTESSPPPSLNGSDSNGSNSESATIVSILF